MDDERIMDESDEPAFEGLAMLSRKYKVRISVEYSADGGWEVWVAPAEV